MPRVFPLRTYNLPDIGDHLIHFTGRTGGRFAVPHEIRNLTYPDRLAQILYQGRIRAVPTFGTGGRPIVAFTESSQASVLQLISEGSYTPWGIGFSKQFIFNQGGGPVLYVRGDEWDAATAALPDPVRARAVRFWPGAAWQVGDPLMFDGAQQLPDATANESQWLHEREWRVPHDVAFGWGDVKFLIVPARRVRKFGCAERTPPVLEAGSVVGAGVSETFDVGGRDVIVARARLPIEALMDQME